MLTSNPVVNRAKAEPEITAFECCGAFFRVLFYLGVMAAICAVSWSLPNALDKPLSQVNLDEVMGNGCKQIGLMLAFCAPAALLFFPKRKYYRAWGVFGTIAIVVAYIWGCSR